MRSTFLRTFSSGCAAMAAAIMLPGCAAAQNTPAIETASTQVSPVHRTTIVVRDMDKALEFFQGILGLTVRRDLPLSGETLGRLLGYDAIEGRIVILQSGDLEIANIALLTYSNIPPPAAPEHDLTFGFGEIAIIMETDRIDEIQRRAAEAGYPAITDPLVIFERPGWIRQSRELIIVGPEGIGINLIEPGIPPKAE